MRRWTDGAGENLRWIGIAARQYELRSAAGTLARLTWRSGCGSLADGETANGRWTLKRMGFFRPFVTVRRAGGAADAGVLSREAVGRERLTLVGGRSYAWTATRERRRERGFRDAAGHLVIAIRPEPRLSRFEGSVRLGPEATGCPDLDLLVLAGSYRLVLEHEDDQAAVFAAIMAAMGA